MGSRKYWTTPEATLSPLPSATSSLKTPHRSGLSTSYRGMTKHQSTNYLGIQFQGRDEQSYFRGAVSFITNWATI